MTDETKTPAPETEAPAAPEASPETEPTATDPAAPEAPAAEQPEQ